MKIFIFADNLFGLKLIKFLKKKKENIVGIALHPKKYQNKGKEILKLAKNVKTYKFGKNISKRDLEKIKKLKPDVILVVFWRFLLSKELIKIPKFGAINFHMSYLPFNRGANPNVWAIIENTQAGCSIHKIDEKIDAGLIIAQKKIPQYIQDTAKTLYFRILGNFTKLFEKQWNKMKKNKFKGKQIDISKGTIHYRNQFKGLSKIDLTKKIYPLELFNSIRAKMFKPHELAYFYYKKKKYFVEIKITKKL